MCFCMCKSIALSLAPRGIIARVYLSRSVPSCDVGLVMECLLGPPWNYTEHQCRRMWKHKNDVTFSSSMTRLQ